MSVLLVTNDVDDDLENDFNGNPKEFLYQQLKELQYDFSSSKRSFSFVDSSSSILVQSNQHYRRQHRQRRRCRTQQCLVQHLLTYMLTLLLLTNHLHWPLLLLSLSSIKILSTQASTITTTTTTPPLATMKRPVFTPSIARFISRSDEELCRPINGLHIDRICSKSCRARKTPYERKFDTFNSLTLNDLGYLPFCANLFNRSLVKENFFNQTNENECRDVLKQIIKSDDQARKSTEFFATYLQSIDSASPENRYSIIVADCQQAYRTWACSVNIPFFYKNQLIPPCHTICDEVERVCPTFRPSDREPLFAGQPLFFCTGGIVPNSDYGRRPHCFDTCHLNHGSLQRPSLLSNQSSSNGTPSVQKFIEDLVTTPTCFDIQPFAEISFDPMLSSNTSNTSLSASSRMQRTSSSIIYTLMMLICQSKFS